MHLMFEGLIFTIRLVTVPGVLTQSTLHSYKNYICIILLLEWLFFLGSRSYVN